MNAVEKLSKAGQTQLTKLYVRAIKTGPHSLSLNGTIISVDHRYEKQHFSALRLNDSAKRLTMYRA